MSEELDVLKDVTRRLDRAKVCNLLNSVKRLNRRYRVRCAKELGVKSLYREVSK